MRSGWLNARHLWIFLLSTCLLINSMTIDFRTVKLLFLPAVYLCVLRNYCELSSTDRPPSKISLTDRGCILCFPERMNACYCFCKPCSCVTGSAVIRKLRSNCEVIQITNRLVWKDHWKIRFVNFKIFSMKLELWLCFMYSLNPVIHSVILAAKWWVDNQEGASNMSMILTNSMEQSMTKIAS